MTTFALHTLGCKVNQCDGDALAAQLCEAGCTQVPFTHTADMYIVNSCTVTATVDKKSLHLLRRARRLNPSAFIALCGCLTQNAPAEKLHEADFIFDTRTPEALLEKLGGSTPPAGVTSLNTARTRAFLKVQDGCDRFCAYCIVPYVRGTLTSMPIAQAVARAQVLTAAGTKEIVLTGIQLAAFGKDNGEALPDLIRAVSATTPRLRLSSLEPQAVTNDFLHAIDHPNVCDHFHLSLQSGCAETLAQMNRHYTPDNYARAAAAIRQLHPHAALTTDIIVGFPGETDADFEASCGFVQQMRFARVHVFPYSPRAGTKAAARHDQISSPVKKARVAAMMAIAASAQQQFLAAQVNRTHAVLWETPTSGHTRNYCLVRAQQAVPNTVTQLHITGFDPEALIGE